MTHLFLYALAGSTRLAARRLTASGFSSIIAPSRPVKVSSAGSGGFRIADKPTTGWVQLIKWFAGGEGGIAGGGLLELDLGTAAQVAPLALVFSLKLLLSNLSFA